MVARRDRPGREGKTIIPQSEIAVRVGELLEDVQASLLKRATEFRDSHIFDPRNYEEFKDVLNKGWAFSWWCGERECEAQIKEETRATTRCIPFDQPGGSGTCIHCGKPAQEKAYFARAY